MNQNKNIHKRILNIEEDTHWFNFQALKIANAE